MILNLTQHAATPDQAAAGVVDLPTAEQDMLRSLLTFDDLPTAQEIADRAHDIAELACYNGLGTEDGDDPLILQAMIGGAPYLMAELEKALKARYITPVYSFSRRESAEEVQPDGSVLKRNAFRHLGFVGCGMA